MKFYKSNELYSDERKPWTEYDFSIDSSALDDKYMNAAGVNYASIIYNCMSLQFIH